MRLLQNDKGLTLVEILVSVVILSIIIVPIMNSFAQSFKANHNNQLQLELHTEAITAFEKIKSAIVDGINVNVKIGENASIEIPIITCEKFTETINENKIILSDVEYIFKTTITIENFSTEEIINEIPENFELELNPSNNLYMIELTITPPSESDFKEERLNVVKLSHNGCVQANE